MYRPNGAPVDDPGGWKAVGLRTFQAERGLAVSLGGLIRGMALEAVKHEICEGVGFLPPQYDVVESWDGDRYDYPPEVLNYVREKMQQSFVGQEHFLCWLHADAPEPRLDQREFCAYRWIAPAEFRLEWKKEVHARVLEDSFNVRVKRGKEKR